MLNTLIILLVIWFWLVAKIDKMGYDKCRNPTAESGIALIPLFESLVFEGKSVWSA